MEDKSILNKADLAKVSGGEAGSEAKPHIAIRKKKGTSCSMCGSKNVEREQKKHSIIQVTCNDCGYQYQYSGVLEEE